MRSVEDIKYEISFIESELKENNFPYLTDSHLKEWLSSLNWVLNSRESGV
jgi:hypothetical protein